MEIGIVRRHSDAIHLFRRSELCVCVRRPVRACVRACAWVFVCVSRHLSQESTSSGRHYATDAVAIVLNKPTISMLHFVTIGVALSLI